ncbi:MAG: polysaccharide deacetylase family protein [Actinomycetota bacterium]
MLVPRFITRRWYLIALVVLVSIASVAIARRSAASIHREATKTTMTAHDPPFAHIRVRGKLIALTFDDGPDPLITPKALGILRETGARATFFTTGMHAAAYPWLVKLDALAGEIGNHTFDHPHLSLLERSKVAAQLATTQTILESITGVAPRWTRPPYGLMSQAISLEASALGLPVVEWDAAVDKYVRLPMDVAAKQFLEKLHPGSIILAHDACPPKDSESWCVSVRMRSLAILRIALKTLQARGWRFVTVSELAAAAI